MHQSYLAILWRSDKKLCWIVGCFVVGLLLPLIIHFEITPFYYWKMYAMPAVPPPHYDTYVLYTDGERYNRPHTWQDYDRMMIMYTLPHYDQIRSSGDTLPFNTRLSRLVLSAFAWNKHDRHLQMTTADLEQYPVWLKRYARQQTGKDIQTITAEKVQLHYTPGYRVIATRHQTLFSR